MPLTAAAVPLKYKPAEAKVKAILPNLLADITAFQAAYFSEHGRYWQGLSTHGTTPDENSAKAADKLDRAPQDRRHYYLVPDGKDMDGNETYRREFNEDTTWRGTGIKVPGVCSVSVSDYNGPQGHGYVITAEIKVGAETVAVVRPFGPERYRKAESLIRLKAKAL